MNQTAKTEAERAAEGLLDELEKSPPAANDTPQKKLAAPNLRKQRAQARIEAALAEEMCAIVSVTHHFPGGDQRGWEIFPLVPKEE